METITIISVSLSIVSNLYLLINEDNKAQSFNALCGWSLALGYIVGV